MLVKQSIRSNRILVGAGLFLAVMMANHKVNAENGLILGLGAQIEDSQRLGADEDVNLIPFVAYETERFYIGVDEITYTLITQENFELSILGEPRDLDDLKKGSQFEKLKRDTAFEVGLDAQIALGPIYLIAGTQVDVADGHKGVESNIGVAIGGELGKGELSIAIQGIHRDEKLNSYLFGVRRRDAIVGSGLYSPKDDWSGQIETQFIYPFTNHLALVAGASIEFLSDVAKDSPRINANADTETSMLIGMMWKF